MLNKKKGKLETEIAALLQEHGELIQLYMHEDTLVWQLYLAFLTLNSAIFTGLFASGIFDLTKQTGFDVFILIGAAITLDIATFFVFQRSKIFTQSRLLRCYQIEDLLEENGINFQALQSAERLISSGKVLSNVSDDTRELHWWEKVEILNYRFCQLPFSSFGQRVLPG